MLIKMEGSDVIPAGAFWALAAWGRGDSADIFFQGQGYQEPAELMRTLVGQTADEDF